MFYGEMMMHASILYALVGMILGCVVIRQICHMIQARFIVGLSPSDLLALINEGRVDLFDITHSNTHPTLVMAHRIQATHPVIQTRLNESDKLVVLICQNGLKSLKWFKVFRSTEAHLTILSGGLKAWHASGLPLSTDLTGQAANH